MAGAVSKDSGIIGEYMEEKLKEKIREFGIKLIKENLTHGTSGNISCRINEKILITPSSIPYEKIELEDIIVVNFDGEVIEGRKNPSIETPLHLAIYKKRKDVHAIIHFHSQYALAVSSTVDSIPVFLDEIFSNIGGELKVAKYALPGSEELAQNVVEVLGDKNAVLLSNHGALSCGKNLEKAFEIAKAVEFICKIYVFASMVGKVKELPESGKEYQKDIFEMRKGF